MGVKAWTLVALVFVSSAFARTAGVVGGAPDIRVDDAWIKPFPNEPAVGYATLTNTGDNPVSLDRVSSPSFSEAAMVRSYAPHRSMPVKNFYIKGHSTLDFRSNHLHILLSRPQGSLDVHKKIPLVLGFSDGSTMTVQFEVRQE
jgi:copper(I)-binding protein